MIHSDLINNNSKHSQFGPLSTFAEVSSSARRNITQHNNDNFNSLPGLSLETEILMYNMEGAKHNENMNSHSPFGNSGRYF